MRLKQTKMNNKSAELLEQIRVQSEYLKTVLEGIEPAPVVPPVDAVEDDS